MVDGVVEVDGGVVQLALGRGGYGGVVVEASEPLEGPGGFPALEEAHHVVFPHELAPALVGAHLRGVVPVTGERPLLFDPDAGGQVGRVLERAGQVADLGFELVDGGGFGGGGGGGLRGRWVFGAWEGGGRGCGGALGLVSSRCDEGAWFPCRRLFMKFLVVRIKTICCSRNVAPSVVPR